MIETARVILRPFKEEDAEGLFKMDSNPEVHRYLGKSPLKSMQQAIDVVKMVMAQHQKNGIARWTAINKQTGEYMGWSGLKLYQEELCGKIDFYEVGYRFLPEYWGQGYATETAQKAVEYGYNELKVTTLYAMAHQDNKASLRVLEKVGFKRESTFIHDNDPCIFLSQQKNA